MGTRQRAVMSLSLPPDTANEYKEIAKTEGKTISGLFREIADESNENLGSHSRLGHRCYQCSCISHPDMEHTKCCKNTAEHIAQRSAILGDLGDGHDGSKLQFEVWH